jgi:site-specific DNA recombinase
MKYIAYNRKSTDEAGNQVLSLETQKRVTDEIALLNNLDVVETLQEARSAKISGNRPIFTSILTRIRDKEIQGIIVAHADRLARNERELADIIELADQGFLKEIWIKDRVFKNYNDFHDLERDLIEAAHFSRKLAASVRDGNETKLLRGEFPNRAPIGYINNRITKKIEVDDKYAPYVQLLFNTYASGSYSMKSLTKMVNERGMRTRYTNQLMQKSTINDILTNPVYYGVIRVRGKLYKGIHEPLISKGLFNTVQDVLHGKNIPKTTKHFFLYRGYVICAICGACYTASIKKGKYKYYYCTNSKGICSAHKDYLDEEDLINLTIPLYSSFHKLREDFAQEALDTYISGLKNSSDTTSKMKELITNQITNIATKSSKLLDVLLTSTITKEIYEQKQQALTNEKNQLELQLTNLKPLDPYRTLEQLELLKERATTIQDMFIDGTEEVRADLLKSSLWNFSLKDGLITSYRFKTAWEELEKGAKSADFKTMYPVSDSNRRLMG